MRKTPTHIDGFATKKLHAFAPEFASLLEEVVLETGHWLRIGAINDRDLFDYMEVLDKASAAHPMSMGIKIDGREDENNNFVLINTWGHLEDFPNPYRTDQNNFYRPVFQTFQLSVDDFTYETSRLPIRIDGQHTAKRLVSRYGIVDIQEDHFQQALFTGLVMAQSFNIHERDNVETPQPMLIPHPRGAFVGNIVPVEMDDYRRLRMEMKRDPDLDPFEDEEDGGNDDYFVKHWKGGRVTGLYQPMLPGGFINIRSFFNDAMFDRPMRRCVGRLRDIFNDTYLQPAVEFAVRSHLTSEYAHIGSMDHLGRAIELGEAIQDVMQSRDWRDFADKSIRNGHLRDTGPTP